MAQQLPQKKQVQAPEEMSETAKKIEAARIEDSKMVRGIFRFHEVPGGRMDFPFLKYPGDEVKKFSMRDGEVYEVPLGVAKHLNTNCWYPLYGYSDKAHNAIPDSALMSVKEKIRRCSFQSLDFIEAK
jgi:hypothetical protein